MIANKTLLGTPTVSVPITPKGTVVYKVTFVDSTGVESNASQAVAFTGVGPLVTLSNIPTGPVFGSFMSAYDTKSRNIYRLVQPTNGSPYYGLVNTIDNKPNTTVNDNVLNPPPGPARWETIPSPNWIPTTDSLATWLTTSGADGQHRSSRRSRLRGLCGTGFERHVLGGRGSDQRGLLISTDGGTTWTRITKSSRSGRFGSEYTLDDPITAIQVLPHRTGNQRTLLVSTTRGLYLITIADIANLSTAPAFTPGLNLNGLPGVGGPFDVAVVPFAAARGLAVQGNPVLFAAVPPPTPVKVKRMRELPEPRPREQLDQDFGEPGFPSDQVVTHPPHRLF